MGYNAKLLETIQDTLCGTVMDISKSYIGCHFNCHNQIEGLFKVNGSHVRQIKVNISEKVHDREIVTADH